MHLYVAVLLLVPFCKPAFRRTYCQRTSCLKSTRTCQPVLENVISFGKIAFESMRYAFFETRAYLVTTVGIHSLLCPGPFQESVTTSFGGTSAAKRNRNPVPFEVINLYDQSPVEWADCLTRFTVRTSSSVDIQTSSVCTAISMTRRESTLSWSMPPRANSTKSFRELRVLTSGRLQQ